MILFWLVIAVLTFAVTLSFIKPLSHLLSMKTTLALLVLIPTFSFGTYFYLGSSQEVAQAESFKSRLADVSQRFKQLGSRSNVIMLLEQKVSQRPNDAKGWYLLGKLYLGVGDYRNAARNLTRANQLKLHDTQTMIALVEARFYSNNRSLSNADKAMLREILKKHPNHLNATNLLAIDAYNKHDYKKAVQLWEGLIEQLPPESDDGKALLKMIAKAQRAAIG